MSAEAMQHEMEALGQWYHRIDLGDGITTPGVRNQALTYALYESRLPQDLTGMTVLDLGANACGLSVEFAKRGAQVTAVEASEAFVRQAHYVVNYLGLSDRIEIHRGDVHGMRRFGKFDIVAFVGLVYHMKHPQLTLDLTSHCCKGYLITSSQTTPGDELIMKSRGAKLHGEFHPAWEPTETVYLGMIRAAGYENVELVSTEPHPGQGPGNILGNRSYFWATAGKPVGLPTI